MASARKMRTSTAVGGATGGYNGLLPSSSSSSSSSSVKSPSSIIASAAKKSNLKSSNSGKRNTTNSVNNNEDIYDFSEVSYNDLLPSSSSLDRLRMESLLSASYMSMMDDSEEEWYPPSPPPYDVFDKLIEANQRLTADPTSSTHVAGKLRWRPDSRLVEIRWLVRNSSLDGSPESSEDVSSTASSNGGDEAAMGPPAVVPAGILYNPVIEMNYDYESDFVDEEEDSQRSNSSNNSSSSEARSTKTSNGIEDSPTSSTEKQRERRPRRPTSTERKTSNSPSSPNKTTNKSSSSVSSRVSRSREREPAKKSEKRTKSNEAKAVKTTITTISSGGGGAPTNSRNLLTNSPYYETSAGNPNLQRKSRSNLHKTPTISSAARARSTSTDSRNTESGLLKTRERTPNRINRPSIVIGGGNKNRSRSLDRRSNASEENSSDNSLKARRTSSSTNKAEAKTKNMTVRSHSSAEIVTLKKPLTSTFSLPDLKRKQQGHNRNTSPQRPRSSPATRENQPMNSLAHQRPGSSMAAFSSSRKVVLDKRKLVNGDKTSTAPSSSTSLRPPPVLVRKLSRNSLSSNSSTSGSANSEDSGTSSSEASRKEAADAAYTQWRSRKREEKRLRERQIYLLGAAVGPVARRPAVNK